MKEEIMNQIQLQMLPYLNNEQLAHLQEVLTHTLYGITLTVDDNAPEAEPLDAMTAFISAKRVEGCSEKILAYYRKTIDAMLTDSGKSAQQITTEDLVDMWLTGFDVPSMATMYIDKPMKGHNLMQAIARVNRVYQDKEAGLIVDYIGMAVELKNALSQYTKRDQDKIPDLGQALSIALEKLEIMRDMFYGFDYSDFFGQDDSVRLTAIANGVNFALGMEEDEQKSFIREATALSQAETLCRSMLDVRIKQEIEFFKCVKAGICKTVGRMGITTNEINARIMKLLEQAIEQDGVYNIFAETEKKNPEISILSEEYMEKIRRMKHKNIAAEMLRKLLEDNIRVFARTGVVKLQLFSEKMQKLLKMYNNRLITRIFQHQ